MGQTASTPASAADGPTVSRQLENFFHVCNIIPDMPQHHRQQWTASSAAPPAPSAATASPPASPDRRGGGGAHPRRRRGGGSGGRRRRGGGDVSTTDYTTDDESDVAYGGGSRRHHQRSQHRRHRRRHHGHGHGRRPTSAAYSDSDADADASSVVGDELLREAPPPTAATATAAAGRHHARPPATTMSTATTHLPLTLDRRYDLDVAPSMVNMNLQWNGAYMVAALLYNEIAVKYGYRHLLSVQQLHWEAVRRYYQLPRIDATGHYKVSLGALLDVVQSVALRSERELSVYADLTGTDAAAAAAAEHAAAGTTTTATSPPPRPPSTAVRLPPVSATRRPFYRMECYTVPADRDTLRAALVDNHLVLCNLTLFSNFLSARRGVVPSPNRDDVPVGMVAATLVGYHADQDLWLVRFPFGLHWGEQGIGYVTGGYLQAYNRDRWVVDVVECGEPPEYRRQREAEQADGVPGRLPVRLGGDEGEGEMGVGGGEAVGVRREAVGGKPGGGGASAWVRLRMV